MRSNSVVMANDDQGWVTGKTGQSRHHRIGIRVIQARGRFVGEHDRGFRREHPGYRHTLLLAQTEIGRSLPCKCFHPELLERRPRQNGGWRAGRKCQEYIFFRREMVQKIQLLEDHPEMLPSHPATLLVGKKAEVLFSDKDISLIRLKKPRDQVKKSGFSFSARRLKQNPRPRGNLKCVDSERIVSVEGKRTTTELKRISIGVVPLGPVLFEESFSVVSGIRI